MSSSHSPASGGGARDALLLSCPHPDSFVPDLLRELRSAVEAFESENGSTASLAAVTKAFKSAGCALDRAAPAPGQHEFLVGERVILREPRQRPDLNGCAAVVKTAADAIEGDGRVEVCVGTGSKKETLRVRPANLRLEWHVAADAHVSCVGRSVLVRSLGIAARGRVCQVEAFDPQDCLVTVHAAANESSPAADVTARVSISDVVPAAFVDAAKEVHRCAMKVVLKAAGARATPAVTQVLNAVHSCASFNIRCARDDEAARVCVTVLKMLHAGRKSELLPQDSEARQCWTFSFLEICVNVIEGELRSYGCFDAACSVLTQCKNALVALAGKDSLKVAGLLINLAGLHEKQGRLADAEAMYKEALRIKELKLGRESLDVASSFDNLAGLHKVQGRLADAEAMYKEALRIKELKLGRESLDVASSFDNLAGPHEKQFVTCSARDIKESETHHASICPTMASPPSNAAEQLSRGVVFSADNKNVVVSQVHIAPLEFDQHPRSQQRALLCLHSDSLAAFLAVHSTAGTSRCCTDRLCGLVGSRGLGHDDR